jgi:hypothetical protein
MLVCICAIQVTWVSRTASNNHNHSYYNNRCQSTTREREGTFLLASCTSVAGVCRVVIATIVCGRRKFAWLRILSKRKKRQQEAEEEGSAHDGYKCIDAAWLTGRFASKSPGGTTVV